MTFLGRNRVLVRIDIQRRRFVFLIEAEDRLITPWLIATGEYDLNSTNIILNNVGRDSHCVDVGANFGYFTCLMARLCQNGKVVGLEADKIIAEMAQENLLINNLYEIGDVRHIAASNDSQDLVFYRRVNRSGNTSIVDPGIKFTMRMQEPDAERFTVRGIKIDDLLYEMKGIIDFIKIDVEGADPLVLSGARETIRSNPRIKILMEWSPGQIQAAGFDKSEFLKSIQAIGLVPLICIEKKNVRVSFDDVCSMNYQSGILFQRPEYIG